MSRRFPSTVSEGSARATDGLTFLLAAAALIAGLPELFGLLAVDFAVRAFVSPRYSPLAAAGRRLAATTLPERVLGSRWPALALAAAGCAWTVSLMIDEPGVEYFSSDPVLAVAMITSHLVPVTVGLVEAKLFFRHSRFSVFRALARTAARLGGPVGTPIPCAPRRFAAGAACVLAVATLVLALADVRNVAEALGGIVLVASGLSAFAGWCAGCRTYALLVRVGVVKVACAPCADGTAGDRPG